MTPGEVKHDYHLVDPSPWPFIGALGAFAMLFGAVLWLNPDYNYLGIPPFIRPWIFGGGLTMVIYTMAGWWRDAVTESVALGEHKPVVKLSLRFGMVLFLAAETMFFASWFWAYFNMAFFHNDAGVISWPPPGVVPFDPWRLPLLATLILLLSGNTVTWAHRAIQMGDKTGAVQGIALTVLLGAAFVVIQIISFAHAPFAFGLNGLALLPFTDPAHIELAAGAGNLSAIYGSVFFMTVGVHAVHVVIGTIFLAVCLGRAIAGHFTPTRHFGFEAAAWYWHFVDVIWLFLFAGVYVLGQGPLVAP